MKKCRLIISIVAAFVSVALLGIVTYSWYVNMETTSNMEFEILQIQSLVSMYEGVDSNHNGLPDKLATANVGKYYNPNVGTGTYIAYADRYYNETYEFKYLDQRYALARDSESNLLNEIVITDLVPSKIYTYKFEITNLSRVGNWVTFGFENDATIDKTKLKDFSCRCGSIDASGNITFTAWTNFTDGTTYSAFNVTPSTLKVDGYTAALGGGNLEVGRLDVWLEIKQKSESTLTLSSFTLPQFRLTLGVDNELS